MRLRPTRPRNLWRVFRQLPPAEQQLSLRALAALPMTSLGLRLFGYNRTWRLLAASALRPGPRRDPGDVDLVARAVNRAARRWPSEPTCLARSLVLWWFLRRRGWPADVWVGVRREAAAMEAHAWVELSGRVLNDRPDVRDRYVAFEQPLAAAP